MALPLNIPPCIHDPPGRYHFPAHEKPLRIQIEGPLVAIKRLLPDTPWNTDIHRDCPQPSGPELARLAYQKIYGRDVSPDTPGDLVVKDEYMGWVRPPPYTIDYYGVTFDHLVPADDTNPEVLQINIIEIEDDNGMYANTYLPFVVDAAEFIGKKVLAVPRCCQKRKGTTDRMRVNESVQYRIVEERERRERKQRRHERENDTKTPERTSDK